MLPVAHRVAATILLIVQVLAAQNRIDIIDGTAEATSRGPVGVDPKLVIQRIPEDQVTGRTSLDSIVLRLQDQAIVTAEVFWIEIRTDDPFGPATGSPDMTPAGLVGGLGPLVVAFPPPGPVSAIEMSVAFAVPLALPPGDLYVCVGMPASPTWPLDGISVHTSGTFFVPPSVGEQMNAVAVGYSGVAGMSGLAWDYDLATAVLAPSPGNRLWWIGPRFVDDVCQPFASNPAVFTGIPYAGVAGTGTGMDPNLGAAGIFPDVARGDGFGWRVRATVPPGAPGYIIVSTVPTPPIPIPGVGGTLLLTPTVAFFGGFTAPSPTEPPPTSEMMFGPYFVPPPGPVGLDLYAQGLTIDPLTGAMRFTTRCRIRF
ncbi:MAG: hypothetical protein IPM29_24515 [Planctomycetes bacterium]|nr:hypothetical protein [Planctomycetota bacterium]